MDLLIIEKNFTTFFLLRMSDFGNICLQEIKEEETKCKLKVTLLIIKLIFTAKVTYQPAFIC